MAADRTLSLLAFSFRILELMALFTFAAETHGRQENPRSLTSSSATNLPQYVTKLEISCSIQRLLILGAAKDIKANIEVKIYVSLYDLIIDHNMASNQPPKFLAHPYSVT